MQYIYFFILAIFGLLFGSFCSVLIYRLKSGKSGITNGRSACPSCNHTLGFFELIPLFSWLFQRGKCKHCHKPISPVYPLLELSMALVFCLMGGCLINIEALFFGNTLEIIKLSFWLSIGFITLFYIFYDILFLEIHEGMMCAGIILAFGGLCLQTFGVGIFPFLATGNSSYAILFLGIISIVAYYVILLKELKNIYDIAILCSLGVGLFFGYQYIGLKNAILSGLLGAYGVFVFFYLQILLSNGKALGGGDLRIGIMVSLLLGASFTLSSLFLTYLLGSIIGIFILIKNRKQKEPSIIPFGPFLGIGFLLTLSLQIELTNILEIIFPSL